MGDLKETNIKMTGAPVVSGTLTVPADAIAGDRLPAVLIIQGSGKIDRNGTVQKPRLELRLYKQISDFIAGLGFITLRYDKRGVGESEGDYLRTGLWDLVEDAERAVEFLAAQPNVDPGRIFVLGHSEGSTIATALCARRPVGGAILLAGGGERLEEALQRQRDLAHADMNAMSGIKGWLIRTLKVVQKSERTSQKLLARIRQSDKDIIRFNLVPMNAKWFREHLAYDVIADLARLECPILAITGTRDVQADADKLKRIPELAKGESEIYAIADMDHAMKRCEGPVNMLTYRKEIAKSGSKPLHEEFARILADWLQRHR